MHPIANPVETESEAVVARRQRIGIRLLLMFSVAYAGFIGLCTFAYQWVTETRIVGIPLTVVYGVGLIFLSIAVAMVYGWLSRKTA